MDTNIEIRENQIGSHLLQHLKCCICMEIYDDPTAVPCGHTFCYKCLVDLANHKKRQVKNPFLLMEMTVPCPNCRCGVPYTNLMTKTNGVVPNFVVMSIIESYQQMREPRSQVDASTNTETLALTGQRIDEISSELDTLMIASKAKTSILQGCKNEIECIRMENQKYIQNQLAFTNHDSACQTNEVYAELNPCTGNTKVAPPPGFTGHPVYRVDPGAIDPAILSIGGHASHYYPPWFKVIKGRPWETNMEC